MIRSITATLVLLLAISAGSAATINLSGVPSFDTNLGTLVQATVTIDPLEVTTGDHQSFGGISNHTHTFLPLAASVPGLSAFPFAPVQTSNESSPAFGTHNHTVDVLPSVQVFTGSGLNWFLNPANNVNVVFFPTQNTVGSEGHSHTVNLMPTVPRTVFEFIPAPVVPEPSTACLLVIAGIGAVGRRR